MSISQIHPVEKYWLVLYCRILWLNFVLIKLFHQRENSFSNMKSWKKAFQFYTRRSFFDQYLSVRRKLSKIRLLNEWNKPDEY